eukprot:6005486-Alexandrium_andersonii.AAC.1
MCIRDRRGTFRALSLPPPDGRRTMDESALIGQLGAPLRGAPSCYVLSLIHISEPTRLALI